MKRTSQTQLLALLLIPLCAIPALGQTGTNLAELVPPVAGDGRGLAFDGTHLYYTLAGGSDIHQITTTGQLVGTITPLCSGGAPLGRPLGALAFDATVPLATVWAATRNRSDG